MKIESGLEGRRARVEMVPLLDVLLIVLIFFLYLSLTLTSRQAIDLSLPSAKGRAVQPTVTVVITRDDGVVVDGEPASPAQVVQRVLRATRAVSHPLVLLRSDRDSKLGVTIELVSLLRRAGVEGVSVEVDGR